MRCGSGRGGRRGTGTSTKLGYVRFRLQGRIASIIDLALDLAEDCAASYRKAGADVRKMWNRAFLQTMRVRDGAIADFAYEEPFASLLGSHKVSMVVLADRCANRELVIRPDAVEV